jgi:hypothetical protein
MTILRPVHWRAAALSLLAAAGTLAAPAPATAQDPVRENLRLPQPPGVELPARGRFTAPAAALGIPTGFGADFGDVFLGGGLQARTRYSEKMDGGGVIGIGLGSARKNLGLEVAVAQFGTLRSCCRGGVSFKAHRMLPGAASIAVGWENAVGWGELAGNEGGPFTDAGTSVYAVASKLVALNSDPGAPFGSIVATLGVGTGRFRREAAILEGAQTAGVFGGVAMRIAQPASVMASWTGQDLNAGISLTPIRRIPVVVTIGAADVTTQPRAIFGMGFGFAYPY